MGSCQSKSPNPFDGWSCVPCDGGSYCNANKMFSWLWDCSKISLSSKGGIPPPTNKKDCECCNRKLIMGKLMELSLFVVPFGTTYGNWLAGVNDPMMNFSIKAFIGSFVILIVYLKIVRDFDKTLFKSAFFAALADASFVLGAQIIADFFFHGFPTKFVAAFSAGIVCWWRQVKVREFKNSGKFPAFLEAATAFWLFMVPFAAYATNFDMMGKNLASRFLSGMVAGSGAFISVIEECWLICMGYYADPATLTTMELFKDAFSVGLVSSLTSTFADGAFTKPTLAGIAGGIAGLLMGRNILEGTKWKDCITNKTC